MAVGFPKKRIRKPLHAFSVAIPISHGRNAVLYPALLASLPPPARSNEQIEQPNVSSLFIFEIFTLFI
jgi:hypothetical protein